MDNIGPLKTLEGIVITTDNDMVNIMNNYFSSVFTIEQLNNVPHLGQFEGNIPDSFNFSNEEVQEKLQVLQEAEVQEAATPQDQICFTLGFFVH